MAKQGREIPQRWDWTEASVWTERMLETLERGIKGGKWFSLMDKVWKMENLQSALKRVVQNKGAAGVDGQKAEQYLRKAPSGWNKCRHAEKRAIHAPTRQAGLDTQAGQQRTQAAGSAGGGGSRRANGGAKWDRAGVREHLCRTQLRFQAATRGQRRLAASGSTARHRSRSGWWMPTSRATSTVFRRTK